MFGQTHWRNMIIGLLIAGLCLFAVSSGQAKTQYCIKDPDIGALLSQTTESMRHPKTIRPSTICLVNGLSVSSWELALRQRLDEISKGRHRDKHELFNLIVEEKVIIADSQKYHNLPSEIEIAQFIMREKQQYDSDENYRLENDCVMKDMGIDPAAYWGQYEWYNTYRICVMKNAYNRYCRTKSAAKPSKDGWRLYKLNLKKHAKVIMKPAGKAMKLHVDRSRIYGKS